MASPQASNQTKPENPKPANGGAAPTEAKPVKAARGTKPLTPLGYVNAVESARKRALGIEERLLKQVPEADRARAASMLKANDGK